MRKLSWIGWLSAIALCAMTLLTPMLIAAPIKVSAADVERALGDIDGNGSVDMNDARLIQDLYQAKYDTFDTITMMKYLRADVNGDRKVDIRDVAWVTWKILGK